MSAATRAFSRIARATLIALLLAGATTLLACARPAQASVHTFKELGGNDGATSTFRVVGVDTGAIVAARLVGSGGHKKVSVATVRKGALSPTHLVRVRSKSFQARALKVRTAPGSETTVPSSVPTGCSTDATSQILSWIDSVPNNSTLRFGASACYRIEGTLELKNRNLSFDGNGSTFKSLNAPSSQRAMWRVWDSTVSFRNMTIIGSYANGGVLTDNLQWAHGIDLRGTDAVVENVTMSDLAGDCVYFGLGADRSSGAVRDSSCRRIGRNAVSVTAGDDILVERVTTNRIGFTAFDVEPNTWAGNGSSGVVFDSNTIGSYHLYAWAVIGNAPISDQAFINNQVVGQGLRVAALYPSYRPQRLTVTGNTSDTEQGQLAMEFNGVDGLTVSGNTVPLKSETMASVDGACDVSVSGNSYPGGSGEVSITNPAC